MKIFGWTGGGLSGNAFGFTASASGINFDPSIGASVNFSIVNNNNTNSLGICKMSESKFKSEEEMKKYLSEKGFSEGKHHIDNYYYKDMEINPDGTKTGGSTRAVYINGKLIRQSITMRPHSSYDGFDRAFNHELIHSYDNFKYGQYFHGSAQLKISYTETKAYAYTDQYSLKSTMPYSYGRYIGSASLFDLPIYLIRTQEHYLPIPVTGL